MSINVVKRDGHKEPLDIDKIHRVVAWSCADLSGVSASEIELQTKIQFYNGMKTSDIQETLIKAAADLISEEAPNYQYVAGRLINYHLRKQVYGKYEPEPLNYHYQVVMNQGYYDVELRHAYSVEEWMELDKYIDHNRDNL